MSAAVGATCALLVACALCGCGAPPDPDSGALVVGVHESARMASIVDSEVSRTGTGPYEVVDSVRDDHVTLAANPRFAGPAPAFERVVVRTIPDPNTAALAIEKGDVAVLADPGPDDVRALAERPGLTFYGAGPANGGVPFIVSSRIAGVVPSVDGALHIELWKPEGAK